MTNVDFNPAYSTRQSLHANRERLLSNGKPRPYKGICLNEPPFNLNMSTKKWGEKCSAVSFPRNRTIFTDGEVPENLYQVSKGIVRLVKFSSEGKRQIIEFLFSGEFFGFCKSDRYDFIAESVDDVVLMRLPLKQLSVEEQSGSLFLQQMADCLQQSLHTAHTHLLMLGKKKVKQRVASFLLMVCKRESGLAPDALDNRLHLPMTRRDIADYLGVTIEAVCRSISDLKAKGIIACPDIHIVDIVDRWALQQIARD